jgi:hypothetical protein
MRESGSAGLFQSLFEAVFLRLRSSRASCAGVGFSMPAAAASTLRRVRFHLFAPSPQREKAPPKHRDFSVPAKHCKFPISPLENRTYMVKRDLRPKMRGYLHLSPLEHHSYTVNTVICMVEFA